METTDVTAWQLPDKGYSAADAQKEYAGSRRGLGILGRLAILLAVLLPSTAFAQLTTLNSAGGYQWKVYGNGAVAGGNNVTSSSTFDSTYISGSLAGSGMKLRVNNE